MPQKNYEDVMVMGNGHSIILNNSTKNLNLNTINNNIYKAQNIHNSISKFGLFGSDIDYNTYYPDVKPEEFTPSNDDIISPVYRLLSECIVNKSGYLPTDFSKNGVLKNSMQLLVGQTVNCDHETNVGNAIGSIAKVIWQDSYSDNGIFIPAGINGQLNIDGKSNPRIARGIAMNPPSIHSNSVTVRFSWEKSHPDMDDDSFYNKLGSYGSDGNMVSRIVTNIIAYMETSLVSHGADPFAQLLDSDGKIVNPNYANSVYNSFSADELKGLSKSYIFFDFKDTENLKLDTMVNNNTMVINNNKSNVKKEKNMDEKFLQSLFGDGLLTLSEGEKPSSDLVLAKLKEITAKNTLNGTQIDSLKKSVSEKDTEISSLKEEISNLKVKNNDTDSLIELGKSTLASFREKVIANYSKLHEKADETVVKLLSTADMTTLKLLGKEYEEKLEQKFPLVCKKCGSKDITRGSAVIENKDDNQNDIQLTSSEVINNFRNKKEVKEDKNK